MKAKFLQIGLILMLTATSIFAQSKGGRGTAPAKPASAPSAKSRAESPKAKAETVKPKIEPPKRTEAAKPRRDTTKAREAAKIGIRRHKEIQEKIVNKNREKSRRVEARMTDPHSRRNFRPDIIGKSGRPFEIKPNTVSGRRKGRQQLRQQEKAMGKRGSLILYEPTTGKYRIERTPYNEWKKRQHEIRPPERPREMRFRGGF